MTPQKESNPPILRSFQGKSYVEDDLPSIIFIGEERSPNSDVIYVEEIRQTATAARPSTYTKKYLDKFDENLRLSKNGERQKIFYENNPTLVPVFRNVQEEERDRVRRNKLFNYFKTQRAGSDN